MNLFIVQRKRHDLKIFTFLFAVLVGCASNLQAQQFDQAYLKWKAQQQAHDEKLKIKDENYYLSRPATQNKLNSNQSIEVKKNTATTSNSSNQVNLNTANVSQLQQLNGVGVKKAQEIIQYRNQNGKFKRIEEIKNVKGIGPILFEKNKHQLRL